MRPDQFYLNTIPQFWTIEMDKEFAIIAMESYPNEACAFIIDNKLVPVENIHERPYEQFELSATDSLLITKAQGFIHSHPDGPFQPSKLDMVSQKSASIPFGIITCTSDSTSTSIWMHDDNLSIDLSYRPFVHGIFDCYSLIRAQFYQSTKIKIMDFPREWEWWDKDVDGNREDLYLQNFEKAGFKEIDSQEEMQVNDVILMHIQSDIVSHAAIYIGEGLLLHHLRGKISKQDHATSWKKFYHSIVRYEG